VIISLTTDFGLSDAFVGAMKGVILGINPHAQIVDVSHEIPPHDVDRAAFVVNSAAPYFPKGTIHVVVVDPGVGTERPVLAARTEEGVFLAPDNGVLKYIFDGRPGAEVFSVTRSEYFRERVSRTFHGRDIFAPVAAHLSRGLSPEKLGSRFEDFERGSVVRPVRSPNGIAGVIIAFDRFGNGVTNIPAAWLADPDPARNEASALVGIGGHGHTIADPAPVRAADPVLDGTADPILAPGAVPCAVRIKAGGRTFESLSRSYLDVGPGEPLVLAGSADSLEISVNRGSARLALGLKLLDPVEVLFQR
jgi:S-adenosyl-L-methionine hydrolase (adenosine-forming)